MNDLLKKRIASRQRIKTEGGHSFTLRRPTEFEKVRYSELTMLEYLCQMIDDCDLTEADLVANGSAEVKVPFERALFTDWMQEHPELWLPLFTELGDMVKAHAAERDDALKNSVPG